MCNDVTLISQVSSLCELVSYLKNGGALGSLVLALTAAFAWLFNKYYTYLYWRHTHDTEILETLIAIRTEINCNIRSYEGNFTAQTKDAAIANARAMAKSRRRFPMLIAESGENYVFQSIKSRLTILPTDVIDDVVSYYTIEDEFSASYRALGNPVLAQRDVEITVDMIASTHDDAMRCVAQGRQTIGKLEQKIRHLKTWRTSRIAINVVIAALAAMMLARKATP